MVRELSRVSVIITVCARAAPKKEGVLLALSCRAIREAFVNRLRVGVMEQSSGSILTGTRAFSAYLPLTPLLWPSTVLLLCVSFQVNSGVLQFSVFCSSTLVAILSFLLL